MELDSVPEHLSVLGGGYVGLEFGQMFRRFGSQVTIVQSGDRLLNREDPDIARKSQRFSRGWNRGLAERERQRVSQNAAASASMSAGRQFDSRRFALLVATGRPLTPTP